MTVLLWATEAMADCPAEQDQPLLPADPALCASLAGAVRDPDGLPLGEYETILGRYLGAFCHRDTAGGWVRDKSVRDTGPYISYLRGDGWQGAYHGTHAPVVIWYSPEAAAWVREHRGAGDEGFGPDAAPVPDGAIIVKEMFPAPAARCAGAEPTHLLPTSGAAVMVRQSGAAYDGWFWGWFGWSDWDPDWPPSPQENRLPYMGFGQYCVNCHASARDNFVFAAGRNLQGEPGEPQVYLIQDEEGSAPGLPHHSSVVLPDADGLTLGQPHPTYGAAFLAAYPAGKAPPSLDDIAPMPSQTYDNVWMGPGVPDDHDLYVTSDQCLACHDAGSTGLHFDMTALDADSGKLWNLSPYSTWRTSPMGLAGRDPFFFAQLASETQRFHPDQAALVETTCLGCHGILGERQAAIDSFLADGQCGDFTRADVDAVPPDGAGKAADYGALARDGISCLACHRMVLGEAATQANAGAARNACIAERQALLNPDERGFARTFTGSFLVGAADRIFGPFQDPRTAPMQAALGIVPEHSQTVMESELCGTCHTVHLPVLYRGEILARIYEQTTYPEWAFSAYRTGTSADGPLPEGAGALAQACQDCHMPATEADGTPALSKIASIQEFSNFPAAEFTRAPETIDIAVRSGFSRHTLVGLNVFLIKIAQQFPAALGLRTQDPMLTAMGVDPLIYTEQQMLNQAANATVKLTIAKVGRDGGRLEATVNLENLAGHKFPSGVGFRRAFIAFEVVDRLGKVLWASGRSDGAGRLVDAAGQPIAGELWWEADCSARLAPGERLHQPHYQEIVRQDQAQIYQELVAAPPDAGPADCGHAAEPAGQLTTSFLSICAEVKDNRLLPHGFLPLEDRLAIAAALGAGSDLAEDVGPTAVGDDPDYRSLGGNDSLTYRVPLAELGGKPAAVRARLYYQATPPFYLQDRFCTAEGPDRDRLYALAGHLNLDGTQAEGWKLLVADTGAVALGGN